LNSRAAARADKVMHMDATHYREKAQQCRRLARDVTARDVAQRLIVLAEEYDAEADAAEVLPDEPEKRINSR
jgi:hypothetical protein